MHKYLQSNYNTISKFRKKKKAFFDLKQKRKISFKHQDENKID